MKEFGSDFQLMPDYRNIVAKSSKGTLYDVYGCMREYACGRHSIEAICKFKGWKRIWIPAYFCYEVIGYLTHEAGIEIKLYDDTPLSDRDDKVVRGLPYEEGDVLLRMNFFALRGFRTNEGINVSVIEDHTHDIISEWTKRSDADYCIASIRKTMPTAAGGILWSPKGLQLPDQIGETDDCKAMAKMRYEGMEMKREYLMGKPVDKNVFREKMLTSEEIIDKLGLSGMDKETMNIAREMNYGMWDELKAENWRLAYEMLSLKFNVLRPLYFDEISLNSTQSDWRPFSITILCDTAEERSALRMHLIKNMIYPAILWAVPEDSEYPEAVDFSKRMLSVHCDPRYSRNDIKKMCERILAFEC